MFIFMLREDIKYLDIIVYSSSFCSFSSLRHCSREQQYVRVEKAIAVCDVHILFICRTMFCLRKHNKCEFGNRCQVAT